MCSTVWDGQVAISGHVNNQDRPESLYGPLLLALKALCGVSPPIAPGLHHLKLVNIQALIENAGVLTGLCFLCRQKDGKVKPSRQEQDAAKRREQMAAAAEARLARLQLVSEKQQLWC